MNIPLPAELQHKKWRGAYLAIALSFALYEYEVPFEWATLMVGSLVGTIIAQGIADNGKSAAIVRNGGESSSP